MKPTPPIPNSDVKPILLFDGTCGLCDRAVQFIIRHDPAKHFRFAPLQSEFAHDLLRKAGIDSDQINSVVLIEDDHAYTKSTAALMVALRLREPWPLMGLLAFVPIDLRDRAYDFIASHRHHWGKVTDICAVPTPGDRERFLS